jgi:hypothetical protein
MLRAAAVAAAIALVAAGGASAETVARGAAFGLLALDAKSVPSVAYVKGSTLVVATRAKPNGWTRNEAASVSPGSAVMAFAIGKRGPAVLVQSADERTVLLVRRRSIGWQTVPIARVAARFRIGWPGLALDRRGDAVVAYSRWDGPTLKSRLLLDRVDEQGRIAVRRITLEGFPTSYVAPPAAPVLFGDQVHVVESYGYKGVLGTIEWYPSKNQWTGFGLDSGLGDWPVGPVLAASRNGVRKPVGSPAGASASGPTSASRDRAASIDVAESDDAAPTTLAAAVTTSPAKRRKNNRRPKSTASDSGV